MALIGYARVSTADQNLALQHDALLRAGCERTFDDQASGARTDRPGLAEALAYLRAGDTLVVWKLDRLGRSMSHLIAQVGDLAARANAECRVAGVRSSPPTSCARRARTLPQA